MNIWCGTSRLYSGPVRNLRSCDSRFPGPTSKAPGFRWKTVFVEPTIRATSVSPILKSFRSCRMRPKGLSKRYHACGFRREARRTPCTQCEICACARKTVYAFSCARPRRPTPRTARSMHPNASMAAAFASTRAHRTQFRSQWKLGWSPAQRPKL